jgi:hypothetical protein
VDDELMWAVLTDMARQDADHDGCDAGETRRPRMWPVHAAREMAIMSPLLIQMLTMRQRELRLRKQRESLLAS